MVNFNDYGLGLNFAIFGAAACAVWFGGTKIAGYADEFAKRFGWSQALLGVLLLAGVTSLPEIATSFTAAKNDSAKLAVNNLLGSIAAQVALLAIADLVIGKRALTSVIPDPGVMLQGALTICLLVFTALAVIVGDKPFLGAGYWTWGLLAGTVYSFVKITESNQRTPWIVNPDDKEVAEQHPQQDRPLAEENLPRLIAKTVGGASLILMAGYLVASTGDAIAKQSGLGASFMGVAFVAIATSLPEASTMYGAMRRGLYTMAMADILGTNILNAALVFGVDLIATGEPVLNKVGDFAAVGALLGAAVTGIFLMGLAERSDRTLGRMGMDSILVLLTYLGGLVILFFMRGSA